MVTLVETDRHKFSSKAMHVLLHGEDLEDGAIAKVAVVDGCIVTMDYYTALGKGLLEGHTSFYSLGYNPNILTTTEDICEWSTTYVVPAAGGIQMRVRSSSASDASAGVGIRTVELHYLDANYAEQLETVTLNGTTVNTVATNILRVNYFHTVTAGSTAQAVGDVTLENTAGTVIYAQISVGGNFSRHGFFTIPAGKTGYISGGYLSCGGTTSGRFVRANLRTTSDHNANFTDGIFQYKRTLMVMDASVNPEFRIPIKVPAKTDIKISAVDENGSYVASYIEGWYE